MDVYWLLFNPLTHDLLTLFFGFLLVAGLVLFGWNLLKLITSYHRMGPALSMAGSLLLVGISAKWEWFLPAISEIMGGTVQYLGIYLYLMVYQWLAQHTTATATALLLL